MKTEIITETAVKSYTYHSPDQKFSICGVIKDGKMRVGIALKNDMDNFSRKLGHKIALGRAIKNPLVEIELDNTIANHAKAFYGYATVYEKVHAEIAKHAKTVTITVTAKTTK